MDTFKLKIAEELLYTGKSLPEDSQVVLLEYLLQTKFVAQYIYRSRITREKTLKVRYYFKHLNGRRLRLAKMLLPRLTITHIGKPCFITGMEKEHGCI